MPGRINRITFQSNQRNLVQVYTNLPPGIDSKVTAYLILIIRLFRPTSSHIGSLCSEATNTASNHIYVQVRWWGEPTGGKCAIFYPRLAHKAGHKQTTCTKARYKITVPLDRFSAYLKDMRELRLDVIDSRHQRVIGRGRLDRIDRLTSTTPIDAILPVINEIGEKLGDLNLSIMIEPVLSSNPKPIITRFNWKKEDSQRLSRNADDNVTNVGDDDNDDDNNNESISDENGKALLPPPPRQAKTFTCIKSDQNDANEQEMNSGQFKREHSTGGPGGDGGEHAVDLDIGSLDQTHDHDQDHHHRRSHKIDNLFENPNNYRHDTMQNQHTHMNNLDDNLSIKGNKVNFERGELLSVALERSKHLRETLSCSSLYTQRDHDDVAVNLKKESQWTVDGNRNSSNVLLQNRSLHHSSPDLRSLVLNESVHAKGNTNSSRHHPHHYRDDDHLSSVKFNSKSNNLSLIKYLVDNEAIDDSVEDATHHHQRHHHHHTDHQCDYDECEETGFNSTHDYALLKKKALQRMNSGYIKEDDKLIEDLLYNKENSTDENEQMNARNPLKPSNNIQSMKDNLLKRQSMKEQCDSNSPRTGCSLKGVKLHFKCLRLFKAYAENLISSIKSSPKPLNQSKLPPTSQPRVGGGGRISRNPTKQLQKSRPTSISPTLPFIKTKSSEMNISPNSIYMELEISVPALHPSSLSSSSSSSVLPACGVIRNASSSFTTGTWTTTSFTLISELSNHRQSDIMSSKEGDSFVNFFCSTSSSHNNTNNLYIFVNLDNTNINSNHDTGNQDNHIRIRLFYLSNPIMESDDITQWESEMIGVNFVNPDEIRSIILSKNHLNSTNPTTRLFIHLCSGQKTKTDSPNVIGRLEFELEPVWHTTPINQSKVNHMLKDQRNTEQSHTIVRNDKVYSSGENSLVKRHDVIKSSLLPSSSQDNNTHIMLETIICITEGKELKLSNANHNQKLFTSKYTPRLQNDSGILVEHTYLIVRLPWCGLMANNNKVQLNSSTMNLDQFHSNVAWLSGSCPQYAFNIRSQCLFHQESLSRLMKSSIVIEVWSKWMSGLPDHLIGLVKIPTESIVKLYAHYDLNSSQIWWHSNSVIQSLLKAQHPMIPVDSWFPITDPFSGSECGQLHILLAVGTQEQINTFSSVQNLKYNIDNMYMMNRETIGDGGAGAGTSGILKQAEHCSSVDVTVEHRINITIEQLRDFDPHISLKHDPHFDGSVPWGDLDCFVQYFFPIDTKAKCLASYRTSVQMLNKPSNNNNNSRSQNEKQFISCEFIPTVSPSTTDGGDGDAQCHISSRSRPGQTPSYWNHMHKLCLNTKITSESQKERDFVDLMKTKIEQEFLQWILDMLTRADFKSNKLDLKRGLLFEIWLRIYSPNLHDCLAAKGYIPEELFYTLINRNRTITPSGESSEHNHQTLRFSIDLFDVNSNSGCLNGRLQISMDYCYNIINQSEDFNKGTQIKPPGSSIQKQTVLLSNPVVNHSTNPILILPSKTQYNHRIQICLDEINLMKSSRPTGNDYFTSHGNSSLHLRVHCVLLIPPAGSNSSSVNHPYYLHVIKSTISQPIYNSLYANELNCKLDVQLPSSWLIAYQHRNPIPHHHQHHHCQQTTPVNASSQNSFEISLLEAILNGDQSHQAQYTSPITRSCIVIQVDVWSQENTRRAFAECDQKLGNFWGLCYTDFENNSDDDNTSYSSLNPGKDYKLVSSCRIPLSGLLFTTHGIMPSHWYPLCSFISDNYSSLLSSSSLWESKFSGAVQLSMKLIDPNMIKIVPCYNTTITSNSINNNHNIIHNSSIIHCLRDWNISFSIEKLENGQTSVTAFKNESNYWSDGVDEFGCQYKHFTIYLNFAHIPNIKQLIKETSELDGGTGVGGSTLLRSFLMEDSFKAYVFVRFQFPNYGTQMSQLVYLPNSTDQFDDLRPTTIIEFKEYKEFVIPVSSELRYFLSESSLELQVWIIWTDENLKETDVSRNDIGFGITGEGFSSSSTHRVPAPRHLGTAIIPLYHLLYPKPKALDSIHSQSTTGTGTGGTTSLDGDSSGLCWWNNHSKYNNIDDIMNCSGLPVHPLYRSNSYLKNNNNINNDSWISVQIEMTGSRTENCLMSKRYHMCKMNKLTIPDINGQLGWNLKYSRRYPATDGITSFNAINKNYGSNQHIHTTDLSAESNHMRRKTTSFPAEIIIEKAYHLRLPHHNKFIPSTESSEQSEPYFKSLDYKHDKKSKYSVFVTFPVDGTLGFMSGSSNPVNKHTSAATTTTTATPVAAAGPGASIGTVDDESLWRQISKCATNPNSCRIAVTPKVKNLEYAHWNYCRFMRIPLELIKPSCSQGLVFHVWTVNDDESTTNNNDDTDHIPRLIGIATVDLTTLSHLFTNPTRVNSTPNSHNEFNQIYGWYHIIDQNTGCPSGQILIGVKPLINNTGETDFSSISLDNYNNYQTKPFENYSVFQEGFPPMPMLYSDCIRSSTHSLSDCHLANPPDKMSTNKEEPCQSELNRSVLFENLRTRLNELDEMNNRFKNRLTTLTNSNEKFFSISHENLQNKEVAVVLSQCQNDRVTSKSQPVSSRQEEKSSQIASVNYHCSLPYSISNKAELQPRLSTCNYQLSSQPDVHCGNEYLAESESLTHTNRIFTKAPDYSFHEIKDDDDDLLNQLKSQTNNFNINNCLLYAGEKIINSDADNNNNNNTNSHQLLHLRNVCNKDNQPNIEGDNNDQFNSGNRSLTVDDADADVDADDNHSDNDGISNASEDDGDHHQSDISIISPLPGQCSSNLFDDIDGDDEYQQQDVSNNCGDVVSRDVVYPPQHDSEVTEELNLNKSYNLSHFTINKNEVMDDDSHTCCNHVLTQDHDDAVDVDDDDDGGGGQEVISETLASSVSLPDDDDDDDDEQGEDSNVVLHGDGDDDNPSYTTTATRSTMTQSPPPLNHDDDYQSIRQPELSLTSSHNILQSSSIQLNKQDEFYKEKFIHNIMYELNQENRGDDDNTEEAPPRDDDETLEEDLKINKDDDIPETSRWDENPTSNNSSSCSNIEQQQLSTSDSKHLMLIPNFFPMTPRIEEIFTNRSSDLLVMDKNSTQDDNKHDNSEKNIVDPLRSRLNARLSEAVHTVNRKSFTNMPNTTTTTSGDGGGRGGSSSSSTDMIITDTITALINSGYKTRSLKKAERVFNMTLK